MVDIFSSQCCQSTHAKDATLYALNKHVGLHLGVFYSGPDAIDPALESLLVVARHVVLTWVLATIT